MRVTSSLRIACVIIGGLALNATVNAETVLVDMGNTSTFRGVSVPNPDANGHTWNSVAPGALVSNLVGTNNVATGIGLGWDTPVGTDSFNGPFGGQTTFPNPTAGEIATVDGKINKVALGDLGVAEAAIDYAASAGAGLFNTVFDLESLNQSETYTLKLYGSHIFSNDQNTVYSVFNKSTAGVLSGLEGSASIAVQQIDTNDPSNPPNIPNFDQVATISGLTANSDGVLFVNFVGANGHEGYLNSFELIGTPTPEPASLGLIALAGTMLARRRRA